MSYKMASPTDIWPAFWKFKHLFLQYGWQTLWRTIAGLSLAIVFGTLIGLLMGMSKGIREGLYPLLVGFNARAGVSRYSSSAWRVTIYDF